MTSREPPFPKTWWKSATVYQIYPSSFADSNGDGIGDLRGILSKLDHIQQLGVDVVWISPIYPSPMADMGYDIADYQNIDPRYGTLEDWDTLVADLHKRGMKLIMDLVVNHTSDEHAWFMESRASRTNAKQDWYIWRPPKFSSAGERLPPNNWRSCFQGSAWEWDSNREEYYLHLYHTKQPDLNWDNLAVRNAVFTMMCWWLDRGCDGFRMDVINIISKVPGLPDAPLTQPEEEYQWSSQFWANGPRVHEYIQEMNKSVLSRYDVFTVGEAPFSHSADDLAAFVLPTNRELQMVFQFELVDIDASPGEPLIPRTWALPEMKAIVNKWQTFRRADGFWNSTYVSNHDNPRAVSRFGRDTDVHVRTASAKLLAMLEIALGGTLFVYQGEEIGMANLPRAWGIEEYKDVSTINFYQKILARRQKEQGKADVVMSDIMDGLQKKARDHARSPMQWSAEAHGGFTTGKPWMRVNDDYEQWNVSAQAGDSSSVLSFWQYALKVRKTHDVLIYGDFTLLVPDDPQLFVFRRSLGKDTSALVVLNFSDEKAMYEIGNELQELRGQAKCILTNTEGEGVEGETLGTNVSLGSWEGRIYFATHES